MLPQQNRLNIQKHYSNLSQQGAKSKSTNFLLYSTQHPDNHTQANVIVPRKVTKLKPLRNLLRRRVLHVLRELWPNLRPGSQVLVIVNNSSIRERSAQQLFHEIFTILEKNSCLIASSPSTKK